jgi:hypothetical protein
MENQEPKQYVSKPLKLNSVPRSENETVNILVQGADKTVKFIPRNEVEVNADWNANWGPAQILNKPDIYALEQRDSDLQNQIYNKQDLLYSGYNIKTINGNSILGEGDISSVPNLQQVLATGSTATINEEATIIANSDTGYSRFAINDEGVETNNFNAHSKKESGINLKGGQISMISRNTATGKHTILNLTADATSNTQISFPNKETAGNYVLATTDDFKTINGESIVGEGDLSVTAASIPDGAIKVAGGLALDGTYRNLTDNLGNPTRLWINQSSITSVGGDNTLNNVAFGPNSMWNASSGTSNTAFGSNTLSVNTSGNQNTAIGYSSLQSNTTGYSNTAIGWASLLSNTEGSNNVALGQGAMFLNKSGDSNIAIGQGALTRNILGNNNIAIGYAALLSNESSTNLAIGTRAMAYTENGNANIALGEESLHFNVDGSSNVAIGLQALKNATSGSGNIAIGLYAGKYISDSNTSNTSSYSSIFLGSGTMPLQTGGSNEVIIGDYAVGAGSNSVTLGNANITKTVLRGAVSAKSYKLDALNTAPASSTAAGNAGEIRVTADYIYVCTAANTWVRSALTTW